MDFKKKELMIKLLYKTMIALIVTAILFPAGPVQAQRQMEKLGRSVVAINQGDRNVYIGWRMLGTDSNDIAFNLYRITGDDPAVKLNGQPLTQSTNYIDTGVDLGQTNSYFVKPVLEGHEQHASAAYMLAANAPVQPYISIPLQTPDGYTPNDASVGDLDGDGKYEIVLHQASRGRDNSRIGITGEPIFEAYKLDGTFLWRINLGKNIREGAHYTQFMVYDLDGDGKAEFACKTADGTIDGQGKAIGNADADYRNSRGYILEGPEFLTIFDGLTGAALATADYIPPRYPDTLHPTPQQIKEIWGDDYGNRVDRFLACIAYLDGERPSLVMCRGYYTRTVLRPGTSETASSRTYGTSTATMGPRAIETTEARVITTSASVTLTATAKMRLSTVRVPSMMMGQDFIRRAWGTGTLCTCPI
jgi:rhamnogalacturonan endolyase